MTEKVREGYRERLDEGDIVYLAEGSGVTGSTDQPLAAKKATVTQTHYNGHRKHYPAIALWDSPDTDPQAQGAYIGTMKSPRELFTEEEVQRVLRDEVGPLGLDERSVDELIADPITNKELAIALGAASLSRLAEDDLRRPGDPEY